MASEPSADQARATEVARIERWRGFTTSSFVLTAADGTVYESAAFRWRRAEPPPDERDARVAYDALVERLLADGWARGEPGAVWCETSFERPLAVEPPELPVATIPVEPARPHAPPLRRVEARPSSPPPGPAEAPPPRAPGRRLPRTAFVAFGSGVVGVALGAQLFGGHNHTVVTTSVVTTPGPRTAAKPVAAASIPAPKPVAKPLEIVVVGARGNGSWLEARRGSSSGKLLYSGLVAPGQRLELRGRRVWARFGAAGNLAITVDGKPVSIVGTYDKTFRSRG